MKGRIQYGACAIAQAATAAAMAQPADNGAARSDANKQICRTIADTGSRLARSRACHTAQEWIELRRQTRQTIDHIQNARPYNGPG